jgi:hypothetical protein
MNLGKKYFLKFGICFLFLIFAGCNNPTQEDSYPKMEWQLKLDIAFKTLFTLNQEFNLEYYVSKPDLQGFHQYINNSLLPYFNNLSPSKKAPDTAGRVDGPARP